MSEKLTRVAIDGPGGAGKSTIAKLIASEFGFAYVDTGAIYRTVGYYVRSVGARPDSEAEVAPLLDKINIDIRYDTDGVQKMILNGEDVSGKIRTPEMSMYASAVSAHPCVRDFLLDMQRVLAGKQSVVMDGRDIGTVVLPNAEVKIFLTASPEERARRRYNELLQRGEKCDFDSVMSDMLTRDKNDSERAAAPLRQADDAVLVDTTELDLAHAASAVAELVREKAAL